MLGVIPLSIRNNISAHGMREVLKLTGGNFLSPPRWLRVCRRWYSMPLRWQSLHRLRDGSEDCFRVEAFAPALPALMPSGHFRQLPAIRKWFLQDEDSPVGTHLNMIYLSAFKDATVPLEFTRMSSASGAGLDDGSFHRGNAPFEVFLDWAEIATEETNERIYLAQASIRDLPQELRDDLHTPSLVLRAGKGAVYDTSIWLGMPPTYTPLHKDPNPNLFVQLAGCKVVRLLPPEVGQEVFAAVQTVLGRSTSASFRGTEMMEGEEKAVLEAAIWNNSGHEHDHVFAGQEAYLSCGDGLFIPKGWWHSVRGTGTGITGSVSDSCRPL